MGATNAKLSFDEGLVVARLDPLGMIDAAVSGELAGVELELHPEQGVNVYVGEQPSYRSKLTLSLTMRPRTLERLVYQVAHKVGLTVMPGGTPAFTQGEWELLAEYARDAAMANEGPRNETDDRVLEMAKRIEAAYPYPARYDDPRGEADNGKIGVPRLLSNDEADAIEEHLATHGQDAIEFALNLKHDLLIKEYRKGLENGLGQHDALDAARKALEEER